MEETTNSFAYTRQVLAKLLIQARMEVERLGGNRGVEKILDMLEIDEKDGKGRGKDDRVKEEGRYEGGRE